MKTHAREARMSFQRRNYYKILYKKQLIKNNKNARLWNVYSAVRVIVLTHMVGSRQMVTEVLDVRSREESFANLHYLV